MKVAYLFSRYPVPSQTFCDTEIRALETAGFEVEIWSCSPPATSFRHGAGERARGPVFYAPPGSGLEWGEIAARREQRWPGAMVADHGARYGERHSSPNKAITETLRRARHAVHFADLFRRRGIEHLHVHFANRATHAALFIHALTGLPFSFTAHAQDFLVDLRSDALLNEMCARAKFVVAVSDWSRRELVRRCPDAEAKIHRVYNGLPLDRWPLPVGKRPQPESSGELQMFSVGRLVAFKGFDDLIAACAELKSLGVPFQCEIAGEGALQFVLEKLVERLGIGDCVRLLGLRPQGEIRARMAACDVFALACRTDDTGACDVLPTVILEAMASARPVVSTTLAGVPEMVTDGLTGSLVTPGNVPALADALAELSHDPARRERFGQAGRRKLEADFCSAANVRQLATLFTHSSPAAAPPPTPAPDRTTTLCLFDRWPHPAAPGLDAALLAWRGRGPGLRLVALTPGPAPAVRDAVSAETLALVPEFEFLPDAMVLEAEWREQVADAHRIETWRDAQGGGSSETDEFLLAGRRALYLDHHWRAAGWPVVEHLHAVGPRALRCACILKWLKSVRSLSFFLAAGEAGVPGLPGSTLRRLGTEFVGGWVAGEHKLATSLGPNFRGEEGLATPADWQRWAETVQGFGLPPPRQD